MPLSPTIRILGRVAIVLALVAHAQSAHAQYRVDVWTTEQGLPQNIVRSVHMAHDGYLWATTLDGVVRFDGFRFTLFNRSTSEGIGSNRFSPMLETADGTLWFGTENGGITRYAGGRFRTYTTRDGLASNAVAGITADASGKVWALSRERIVEWNGERFRPYEGAPASLHFVPSDWYGSTFWAVDGRRLVRFAEGVLSERQLPQELEGRIGGRIEEDPTGTIWLTLNDGRYAHLTGGQSPRVLKIFTAPSATDPHVTSDPDSVTSYTDRRGRIWPMAVDSHLYRRLELPGDGTAADVLFVSLHEDNDGNLWLGTDGQGLRRVRRETVRIYSTAQGLVDRNAYAVLEDRAGSIWIGAWERGLSRIQHGRVTNFTTAQGLVNGLVMALAEDQAGRIWISARDTTNGGPLTAVSSSSYGKSDINCYRIVQECLSNIVRHARATRASIHAAVHGEELQLTISDNGVGLEARHPSSGRTTGGLGMIGVAERARMLGGSHLVTSRPGSGTTIVIRFPVSATPQQPT